MCLQPQYRDNPECHKSYFGDSEKPPEVSEMGVGLLGAAAALDPEITVVVIAAVGTVGLLYLLLRDPRGLIIRLPAIITISESTIIEARPLRWTGDKRTARQIISQEKEGGINREWPRQYDNYTPDEIYKEAARGGEAGKAARKAKKLLDGTEYDKHKK
jgi:hypothetical protein